MHTNRPSRAHVPQVMAQPSHLQQQQVSVARHQPRLALPEAGAQLARAVSHAQRVRKARVGGACGWGGGARWRGPRAVAQGGRSRGA